MNIIYSDMDIPETKGKSIFLAGPTPREENTKSWRIEALKLLEEYGYKGTVYVPERRDWKVKFDYTDQVDWELTALSRTYAYVFWIPRDLKTMPAFTTNIEFGMCVNNWVVKMVYGRPNDAPKNRYLDHLYNVKRPGKVIFNKLNKMIKEVVGL